jgi:peptide/nickel transport system permease protein
MSMWWYVSRRLLWTVVACYLVLSITFGLIVLSPNVGEMQASFAAASQGGDPEEAREAFRERRGLDQPIWVRYKNYMVNMATFNWGWSDTRSQPVVTAISESWPYSAQIIIPTTIFAVVAGFGIGLYSAANQHTVRDYVATFFAFFGISIPNFWFGIMLILICSVWLREQTFFGFDMGAIAPPTYYHTGVPMFSVTNLNQIVLPILVTSTYAVAGQMRYSRAEALEYINAQFVKTARAKGASESRVLLRHVFRPALVPLTTILVGDVLAILWGGALITEIVFQIPGIGLLGYKAIIRQDTPLVLATILIPVILTLLGNLVQDIMYTVLDPRIDYGGR